MPLIQFSPLQSSSSPSFWAALSSLKLDQMKLDDGERQLKGLVIEARSVVDRSQLVETQSTRQEKTEGVGDIDDGVFIGGSLVVDGDAFDVEQDGMKEPSSSQIPLSGTFKNFNTLEEFKGVDIKKEMFGKAVEKILHSFSDPQSEPLFNHFLLLTFSDLKKYKFHYWFAFPALVSDPSWEYANTEGMRVVYEGEVKLLVNLKDRNGLRGEGFLLRRAGSQETVSEIKHWTTFFEGIDETERTLVLHDPSTIATTPSWLLRNILYYLSTQHGVRRLRVILLRDGLNSCRVFDAILSGPPVGEKPKSVGWERNQKGVLASRIADLGATMDPTKLADQAVDLNLKLIKWRILPSLDLEKIRATKCLLLGAGTLGCYVARCLMGWGVRNITFVDSATVSFSNPVRQPLFEFEDCLDGGKPKAQCAADSLKRIFPGVNATGINLSIPMPGHPVSQADEATTCSSISTLNELISSHDAVFLLMDSRESRWLPTVIGSAENKIVINAALGFDSWLVMRHGAGPEAECQAAGEAGTTKGKRLGCYYCNDIVAPADSLTDRTLDQMCTVTRPGVAPIAAASAVELLISLIQHPMGIRAPAETMDSATHQGEVGSPLGLVPHQLRAFLGQWRTMLIEGAAYDRCTGCSKTVVDAYRSGGFPLLLRAFNEPDFLEKLTGLDKLYDEGEAVLEAVEWDESDQEGSI